MRDAIWKTPVYIEQDSSLTVKVPVGSVPLCLQLQRGVPTIWWRTSPHPEDHGRVVPFHVVDKKLIVFGTGWLFEPSTVGLYIGTWQDQAGLVWHAFEAA